jgi:hypothetical protein
MQYRNQHRWFAKGLASLVVIVPLAVGSGCDSQQMRSAEDDLDAAGEQTAEELREASEQLEEQAERVEDGLHTQ